MLIARLIFTFAAETRRRDFFITVAFVCSHRGWLTVVVVSLILLVDGVEKHMRVFVQAEMQLFQRWQQLQQLLDGEPVELRVVQYERAQIGHAAGRRLQDGRLQPVQAQIDKLDARHLREDAENLLDGTGKKCFYDLFYF